MVTSTGSAGDRYDNAMAESFFATLECELIDRRSFQTQAEARTAIFAFVEGWYNTHRLHSALGYLSPNCCFSQSPVESPRLSAGVLRRRIGWDDGAIRSVFSSSWWWVLWRLSCIGYRSPSCRGRHPHPVHTPILSTKPG